MTFSYDFKSSVTRFIPVININYYSKSWFAENMNIQKSVISDTNTLIFQGDPKFQAVFDKLSPYFFSLILFWKIGYVSHCLRGAVKRNQGLWSSWGIWWQYHRRAHEEVNVAVVNADWILMIKIYEDRSSVFIQWASVHSASR